MLLIDEARLEINEIDKQMVELFIKRIAAVNKVLQYKIENNLAVLDETREISLIKKNIELLNNKELEKYYLVFLEGLLNSSKQYQKDHYE